MRIFLCLFVTLMLVPFHCLAQTSSSISPEIEKQHRLAIDFAHKDQHDKSLTILHKLMKSNPDYYPIVRDVVVVSSWNNMCDDALKYYKKIAKYPKQESYLVIPVSECMAEAGQLEEAKRLLLRELKKSPNDKELKDALNDVQDQIVEANRGILSANLENDNTNGPNNEWRFETRYLQPLTKGFSIYGRYFYAHSSDEGFDTEDMNRVGIGAIVGLHKTLTLDQQFSVDIDDSEEHGSHTNLNYVPDEPWSMNLGYTTYYEGLPLRAKAQDIKANGWYYNVYFHTSDYRWEWFASTGNYRFTDENHRISLYTEGAYAFELKPKREQRVILELDFSKNSSIDEAYYFNPERSSTVALAYKLDLVLDTRFDRHVDTLYAIVGNYYQKGYNSHIIAGVFYRQDYDFNKTTSLNYGLGYSTKVYDGEREGNVEGRLNFNKRF